MVDLTNTLKIGISSRTLFDLEQENELFIKEGVERYRVIQRERENIPLNPGTAFHLVKALLNLNKLSESQRLVEVIVMSSNSPETGVRVLNSINHHGLDITRSAFTGGESIAPYIESFEIDLFLSKSEKDVQAVIDSRLAAAALILNHPDNYNSDGETVRIAFDADAVVFSDDSEYIYKTHGLEEFQRNEVANQDIPMREGPMGKLLKTLAKIQKYIDQPVEVTPIRIAIVTARNSPSHMRVINTLRDWDVHIDEAFFLGGLPKHKILKAFNAHIFFDDQDVHLDDSQLFVPSGKVPYSSNSKLRTIVQKKKK